jgi:hypothetical protein
MYVNDGVCDYEMCCDGSDEWAAVGGTKCEDKCKEIGKEWRRLDDLRTKSLRNALMRKEGLLKDAGEKRRGLEEGIKRLEGEIRVLEHREEDLKKVYEDVERKERGRVVGGSAGKVSKVTVLAGLAKARVEELRSTLLGVVEKRNKLKEKVAELEGILSKFKEERNPNFNDEGVKRAVQAWEDYAANRQGGEDDASERDVEAVSKPDSESEGINWVEWETEEEESDVDASRLFPITPIHTCKILIRNLSLQIRRIPPRLPPFLGPFQNHRLPHLARRKRYTSRQRQLRIRIQSRLRRALYLSSCLRRPEFQTRLPRGIPNGSCERLRSQ